MVKPFEVRHIASELRKLADYLKNLDAETGGIMDRGRYYQSIARYLYEAGIFVSAVHAKVYTTTITTRQVPKLQCSEATKQIVEQAAAQITTDCLHLGFCRAGNAAAGQIIAEVSSSMAKQTMLFGISHCKSSKFNNSCSSVTC